MKWKIFKKSRFWLLSIILLAFFLRFAGLSWGLPYHFHPDEWNMAAAVTGLSWTEKLNPHFFAYGQLPLYLAYFSGRIYNLLPWIALPQIDHAEATFFLRFWSALAGVGTVYLVYLITKRFLTTNYPARIATQSVAGGSLLATLLAAFTPGLIQISHFGTTESLLAFFFLMIFYFSLKIAEENKPRNYLLAGLAFGLALGTKISALVFAFPVILAFLFKLRHPAKESSSWFREGTFLFLFLCTTAIFFLISSPYVILNFSETKRILLYETQVASGQSPVFYTRQFFDTTPVIFQLQKIFPYALGWPIFTFGSFGFIACLVLLTKAVIRKKFSSSELPFLVFSFSFLVYFISQAFLFTKWTRFLAPIFAFFPIFTAFTFAQINSLTRSKKLFTIYYLLFAISIIPGLIFSTIYFRPDIRFTASEWIYKNIPSGSQVLSETGNGVDLPILPSSYANYSLLTTNYSLSLVSFDFYHLDENPNLFPQLLDALEKSDYVFVPSRRIFANHQGWPEKYPLTAKYYELLFSGKLGFSEIKKFSPFNCSLFTVPRHLINDESAEETWSVFDHPVIRIYKKRVELNQQDYEKLFKESR